MVNSKVQPYLTSEDGELFDLSISHGAVAFAMLDLEENEIHQFIADIQNMLCLLQHGGSDNLKERNEASMQECLVE